MANIDDVKAKTSCPLHTLFCIINQIQADCVEPWYEQIKRFKNLLIVKTKRI